MTLTLTYEPQLSRVRASGTALPLAGATALLERSPDGIRWTTVRGGVDWQLTAGATDSATARPVDDYEFLPDVANTYRLSTYDTGGVQLAQETAAITPNLAGSPWLKVIARPFLNRPVTVLDYTDVQRKARGGVFEIVGRSVPVAVSDVRASRTFTLRIVTQTRSEADELELVLSGGDAIVLQVPADCDVPAGYFVVGDLAISKTYRYGARRVFELPLTEVAAPGPDVVGAASTWQTVLNNYPDWTSVIAAYASWDALLETIGTPGDVIVP